MSVIIRKGRQIGPEPTPPSRLIIARVVEAPPPVTAFAYAMILS